MATIAITGSSGLIGRAVGRRLAADGHRVVPVLRGDRSGPAAGWDPPSGWVRPDLLDGIDVVISLGGASLAAGRWTDARKHELIASRVDSTRLLVDHMATLARRPSVFISASGAGFYGHRGDEELTEASARGSGFLADLVAGWEAEVAKAAALGVRTVMLRFGVVLDKRGGALPRLLLPFKLGAGGRIGGGRQYMPTVSLADAASAVAHVVATPSLEGPVNVAGRAPATNGEFTKALGAALHRPTLLPTPTFGLNLLLGGETVREMLLASQRVLPEKLQASGFVHQHPDIAAQVRAALA